MISGSFADGVQESFPEGRIFDAFSRFSDGWYSVIYYQLNILRREGLVQDVADPKDRRCRSIGLTDKGRMVAGWS